MAVARAELTPNELDWIVGLIDSSASKEDKKTWRRAIREIKRAREAAHESYRNEMRELDRIRSALPTAPKEE
jgi:hypothetical protein